MCRVKMGAQISGMHDVQNLVTACILRSQNPFSISGLTETVMEWCQGSNISISDTQVEEMVSETTMAFLRIKLVSANADHYFAYPAAPQKATKDSA